MFSANENIQLRQFKKRVVGYVESTLSDDILDLGVNVMVMQVSCKAPGCVPLETAIVIIFPQSATELLPGLSESAGGSFKTKILKPMADVTQADVLDALPPAFEGGRKTMESMCLQARDVMLGQITQLFGDEDSKGRKLMAQYLMTSLQDYIDAGCEPPEWGEEFKTNQNKSSLGDGDALSTSNVPNFKSTGNIVLQRPTDDEETQGRQSPKAYPPARPSAPSIPLTLSNVNSVTKRRQQQNAQRRLEAGPSSSGSLLAQLAEREHAPGVRRAGCPCCDPDNPSNVVDRFMRL